jgi:DNA-binding SARP family transcriptional activator
MSKLTTAAVSRRATISQDEVASASESNVRPIAQESTCPRLVLLRSFELRNNGMSVTLPLSAQRLLAFLALRDRPLHRLHVAGTLWIDASEERAAANLRTALWRLRQAGTTVVEATITHLRIARTVTVDVREALELAHRLLDERDMSVPDELDAERLTADLLPDWYDDWVLLEQERFRQTRLHALEALCQRLANDGRFAAAVDAGLAAVAGEPLRESAQRVLIKTYLAEGNAGEAIRQYRRYRQLLHDGLALEPSPLMNELVAGLPAR